MRPDHRRVDAAARGAGAGHTTEAGPKLTRDIPTDPPSVRTTLAAGAYLSAICRRCQHAAEIDLAALERRGLGDLQLLALRLRCTACGAADCSVVVAGRYRAPF